MQNDRPYRPTLDHAAAREAHFSIAGYRAQIWRSVLAWVRLREDEILFLEAAEDFDIVRTAHINPEFELAYSATAETVQVKNTRKPISLRSDDVIKAIGHAFEHQRRNPNCKVLYRYMTTSGIAVESGAPFGPRLGGIRAWQRAQRTPDARERAKFATSLISFLRTMEKLSEELRYFLDVASATDVLSGLVDKIHWDTEADSVDEVVRKVRDRLVMFGRTVNVDHAASEAVAEVLFERAFLEATKENRRYLTSADFIREFEEKTLVQIPRKYMMMLLGHLDTAPAQRARRAGLGVLPPGGAPERAAALPEAVPPPQGPNGSALKMGNRLAIIVGDVLDETQAIPKRDFLREMQAWRTHFRELGRAMSGPQFAAEQNEQAFQLLNKMVGQISDPYLALARLRPGTIVCLFPDPVLERTFSNYRPCTTDQDLVTFDLGLGSNELFLLGGSAVHGVGVIANDPANLSLANRLKVLGLGFRDRLAMCDILAIRVDATQFVTQQLLQTILNHRTERDGRIVFVDSHVPANLLARLKATELPSPIANALGSLFTCSSGADAAFKLDISGSPARPFKYLDYYRPADAALFKGRDTDTDRIVREIKASAERVIILTGRSGVGKTSIINASVAPMLENQFNSLVVYARCGSIPEASIIAACEARTGRAANVGPFLPEKFADALAAIFAGEERNCVIVLDQAEEAFVTLGTEVMRRFVGNMENALRNRDLPLRFMFVLRSDYLKELLAINSAGFPILGAPVYLDDMTWDQARQAIIEPFLYFGIRVEEALADVILGDLDPERILPAHLSIVCDRMFSEMGAQSSITLEQFRQKQLATQSILVEHLRKSLEGVKPSDAKNVERILLALVTGEGTKDLLSASQIAKRTRIAEKEVRGKLQFLIHDCRLLREVEGQTTRFELAHETLAEELHARIDRAKRDLLEVQDMLGREVAASQFDLGRLIAPERLSVFDAKRHGLVIDADAAMLIVASFSQHEKLPAHWRAVAAGLDNGRLVEAAMLRPIAAGYAYLSGILGAPKRQAAIIRPFKLSDLSYRARAYLIEQISCENAAALELLAPMITDIDDSAGCVAVLVKCTDLIAEGPKKAVPAWLKALFGRAIVQIGAFAFSGSELDEACLAARHAIITLNAQDAGIELAPLHAWLLSSITRSVGLSGKLISQVLEGAVRNEYPSLDVAIIAKMRPVEQLEERILANPIDSFPRLMPLLFDAAPDRGLAVALKILPQLDVDDVNMLAEMIVKVDQGGDRICGVTRQISSVFPEPQLIHLLFLLYGMAPGGGEGVGGQRQEILRAIRTALCALSDDVLREFPSYHHIHTRFGFGPDDSDKFYKVLLDPQWQVLAAYVCAATADDTDWPWPPTPVWRAACRLYVASGSHSSFPTLGSIEELIKRNSDPDERVSMLLKLTTENRQSVYRATVDTRRLVFCLLAEDIANPSLRSERNLVEISKRAPSRSDQLCALLILQKCGSAHLTAKLSEAATRSDMRNLSATQRGLLGKLFDDFCARWSDEAVFSMFRSSDPTMTQLAGRCLSPARGVFSKRPHLLKAAIGAIRSRPLEYRMRWLKTAQEGLGTDIPPAIVAAIVREDKPVSRDITVLTRLYE